MRQLFKTFLSWLVYTQCHPDDLALQWMQQHTDAIFKHHQQFVDEFLCGWARTNNAQVVNVFFDAHRIQVEYRSADFSSGMQSIIIDIVRLQRWYKRVTA